MFGNKATALTEADVLAALKGVKDPDLNRALVDLAAFYRDVLLHHAGSPIAPAHPDYADDVVAVAARLDPPGTLRCLDAILGCREALDLNVKPRIAVEAMTAALRLP